MQELYTVIIGTSIFVPRSAEMVKILKSYIDVCTRDYAGQLSATFVIYFCRKFTRLKLAFIFGAWKNCAAKREARYVRNSFLMGINHVLHTGNTTIAV